MRSRALGHRSASPVKAARYPGTDVAHQNTIRDLQRVFELPPASAPLLDQALTHSSWANATQPKLILVSGCVVP